LFGFGRGIGAGGAGAGAGAGCGIVCGAGRGPPWTRTEKASRLRKRIPHRVARLKYLFMNAS
jgi:hypothetical protein